MKAHCYTREYQVMSTNGLGSRVETYRRLASSSQWSMVSEDEGKRMVRSYACNSSLFESNNGNPILLRDRCHFSV